MWYKNTGYFQEQNFSSVAAELNSSFGKLSNLFRFTYTNQDEPRSTSGKAFPFVDILKDKTPFVSFGTELFSYGNLRKVESFTLNDDVTFGVNKHTITAGLQFEYNHTKNGFQRFGTGYYAFDSWEDFILNKPAKSFAITHPNDLSVSQVFPSFKFNQFTLYAQDEITISERLKILAGIRTDLPFYPKIDTYNPKVAELDFDGKKFDTGELPSAKVLFSPRLGFNYDIKGDRSIVLRGGTGLFTGTIPFVWIVAQASDAGVLQTTYSGKSIPSFKPTTSEILNEIYPSGLKAEPALPSAIVKIDNNLKLPQNWKSSLAIDIKLPWNMNASLEGIYSKDIHSVAVTNVGLKPDAFQIERAIVLTSSSSSIPRSSYLSAFSSKNLRGSSKQAFNLEITSSSSISNFAISIYVFLSITFFISNLPDFLVKSYYFFLRIYCRPYSKRYDTSWCGMS